MKKQVRDDAMVKVGFLGYGYWGPNVLRSLYRTAHASVVKACDVSPQNAQRIRNDYPGLPVTQDTTEIINDPAIDAVYIATPAETHFELTAAALNAGKHVCVEKPIALLPKEAQKLIEIAARCKKILMVGHVYEYNMPINVVKQYLVDGEVGKVQYVCSRRASLGPRVRTDVNVVWDYAIHDIYLSMFLLDAQPLAVRAIGSCCLQKDIEDVVFIDLFFPDNVLFHIECSWYQPVKQREITIVGNERMVVYDDMKIDDRVTIYQRGFAPFEGKDRYGNTNLQLFDEGIRIPRLDWREPLAIETEHFIRCILDGTKPRSDGEDGKRTLEIIHAINQSLKKGGATVKIS